ncbi:tetratricopeptide repeat protein [Mycobacterium sp. MYCO198283]|uniref:tetratricopeptide repeat protein n=1 Tax=Mycobacterium sp. MYCO198283 TaxID=2883505 RepID=UPI001E2CCEEC|nr:tetratricopeptide repeat protein [Mycobacterium sp. MYCO198283]MCG5434465.1 tetratricopeptide repeat protein [Mycobacterium sp. MYCO198283]
MTRPRPSIAPAMAGAVDLSALKQRATQPDAADAAPAAGVEVTEANLEAEVIARSNAVPVVVVLWTPRSNASTQLVELFGALAAQSGNRWALATVNVDTTPRVAQVFGVQAVPTVVALAGGQPISNFEGMQPPEQLRRWVDSLVQAVAGKLTGAGGEEAEPVDPALQQARDHLDAGDFDAARATYLAILEADPQHAEAKGAIRQLDFLGRATAHRPDAVAVADAAPADVDAALAAADVEILQQQPEAAFARLIAQVRRTAGDERARVRSRLIELFDLFDPADPAVLAARRNLANALY